MSSELEEETNNSNGTTTTITPPPQSNNSSTAHNNNANSKSTLALCLGVFCLEYMLFSPFSYSGFMAIDLVGNGHRLTAETAGPYAGLIVSSFMVGRACSSYPWGRLADMYGRRLVMIWSLIFSTIFSLAFGLSTTLMGAMMNRFLMGLGNGIMLVARTSVTELAKGNIEIEKKAMGHIMSMVGYAMLASPAIGGTLSEPLKQYPNVFEGGIWEPLLRRYPFILPNICGAIIALVSLVAVVVAVEETLPPDQLRPAKYLIPDLLEYVSSYFCTCFCKKKKPTTTIHKNSAAGELSGLLNSATTSSSYNSEDVEDQSNKNNNNHNNSTTSKNQQATLYSIMSKKSTRQHLICYWMNAFCSVASNEAFPLFAMARNGGLGWKETRIGGIGTAAGLIYVALQHQVYTKLMARVTVHQGLRISAFGSNMTITLIPISLALQRLPVGGDHWSFVFLCLLYGVIVVFSAIFYACITITTNRTVESSHRATMNGLSSLGSSIGRGIGPLVAGVLVASSMSGFLVPAETFGAILLYGILGILGYASFWTTLGLNDEGNVE